MQQKRVPTMALGWLLALDVVAPAQGAADFYRGKQIRLAPQSGERIAALVAAAPATPEDIVRKAQRAAAPD